MGKRCGYHILSYTDRLTIEKCLKVGFSAKEIAEKIGCTVNTIYNEKKRGVTEQLTSSLERVWVYCAETAERKYREKVQSRSKGLKIGKDHKLAALIEQRIAKDGYSPEAVAFEIRSKKEDYSTTLCFKTIYNYIDQGLFLSLTNKDLPVKGKRKRRYRKVKRQARACAGTSIEKRSKHVEKRTEFGHWEMDSVKGRQGITQKSLLAMTERKTRYERLFLLPDGTTKSVVEILDYLEKENGPLFAKIFKTITVDNGSEFADASGMEASCLYKGANRTEVFYCHAYCSCERGSNENLNRMVRRKIPKGTDLDQLTNEDISNVQEWMNNYPRRILKYQSASQLFETELEKIRSSA